MLQEAKARFSEVVRRARAEGPQTVMVHGRDEVVVLSVSEFKRLTETAGGDQLVSAFRSSPHKELDIAPARTAMPVRDVAI
jgi:prevent-host-death family protein